MPMSSCPHSTTSAWSTTWPTSEQGGQWIGVDTGGLLGDVVVRYVDPRVVLDTVQDLTEATEDGSADLDGVDTTRYRSVIDLGDETLAQSGWLAYEGVDIDADGEITVEFYVDDDGLLRRLDIEGDLEAPDGETGEGSFEVSTTFSDLGADLTVDAPEGAELLDPLAEALDFDDGEFDDGEFERGELDEEDGE